MRGRNLRFWRHYALELLGIGLGAAFFCLVVSAMGAKPEALPGVLMCTPYYLSMGCAFGLILCCFSIHISYLPLILAMGSTRREAFWGFLLCRLAVVAAAAVVSLLVWLLLPGDVARDGLTLLPLLALLMLLSSHLGSLMGLLYQKWKGLGICILAVLCGAAGAGASVTVMTSSRGTALLFQWMGPLGTWIAVGTVLWLLLGAADLLLTRNTLRRREVKL